MRISDWSSDVCSSDLGVGRGAAGGGQALAVGDADDGRRQRGRTDVQAAGRLHGDGEGDPLAGVVPAVEYEGVGQGAVAVVGIDQGEDVAGRALAQRPVLREIRGRDGRTRSEERRVGKGWVSTGEA